MSTAEASPTASLQISAPERVSKTAVLSLIGGLLSCIPGVGLAAALLGVVALQRISASRGRVGGRTPAAVGMTFGLIASAIWLSLVLGIRQEYGRYVRAFATPATSYFSALGDDRAVAAIFATPPSPRQIQELRAWAAARLGAPVRALDRWDDVKDMLEAGRSLGVLQPSRVYVGGPLRFDKGVAYVFCAVKTKPPSASEFPSSGVEQLVIVTNTGESFTLEPEGTETPR